MSDNHGSPEDRPPENPWADIGREARRQIEEAEQRAAEDTNTAPGEDHGTGGKTAHIQLPSDSFPGYQIIREIHRGGQGVVYLAIQKSTKRQVALKVLREGVFASQQDRARFEREVQILGRLNHPNIVSIHDSGSSAGHFYFVMAYISGQPLDVYMAGEQRPIDDTLRLFSKICDAVNAAHLRGVIHRDLKPSNIRIDAAGEPHVLDFGLAKVALGEVTDESRPQAMTLTGQFVGSLPWASPEQAEGAPDKIDTRTDVYSLGVILYQMLTGRFPYPVALQMRDVLDNILNAEPAKPSTVRRQINDEVETIVLKCLSKQRERRYETAGGLARDIHCYLDGQPIEAKRDSLWYLLHKRIVRRKWQISALVGLAVVSAVAYGFWSRSRRMELLAQTAADSLEQQRIAARIRSDWEWDDPEIRGLYDDFFERLQSGQTTAEERELYFSHALAIELKTHRLWGLDFPWCATLEVGGKADFEKHGIALRVSGTYELGSRAFAQVNVWPQTFRGSHGSIVMCEDPSKTGVNLEVPGGHELRTSLNLAVTWEEDVPEKELRSGLSSSWNPPNPIWTGQKVLRQPITLLRVLPDDYPPAITDPEVAKKVETGFQADMLWVGDEILGFDYVHAAPLYIAGWLEVLDSRGGPVLGRRSIAIATWPLESHQFGSPESAWPPEFLKAVRRKELTSIVIRIVPDRRVALSVPDLEAYYGRVIERTIPVADITERNP